MKYLYETHMHTYPVSKCGKVGVREALEYYKRLGYTGVFITNHFIDGNIGCNKDLPYAEIIDFYFSDYEEGKKIGEEIGLSVFLGVESSYKGTDFLIYGLDKSWYLAHPEILEIKKSEMLPLMMDEGALIIQAHPYREAGYIDHIRLFPRQVHGVEVFNACRTELENYMAEHYSKAYSLLRFSGSDNHVGPSAKMLAGMSFDTPISTEKDFVSRILDGEGAPFKCTVTDDESKAISVKLI